MSAQSNFTKVKLEKSPSLDQVCRYFEIHKQNLFSQTFNNIFALSPPVYLFIHLFIYLLAKPF